MKNLRSLWDEDSWSYSDLFHVVFSMVLSTQEWGLVSGPVSRAGTESIDVRIREFISSEVTRTILECTPVVCGLAKEGIFEL